MEGVDTSMWIIDQLDPEDTDTDSEIPLCDLTTNQSECPLYKPTLDAAFRKPFPKIHHGFPRWH